MYWIMASGVLLFIAVIIVIIFIFKSSSDEEVVNSGGVVPGKQASAEAQLTPTYKAEIRKLNQARLDKAKEMDEGVSMPYTFNDKNTETSDSPLDGDGISNCGCVLNDAELKAALARLGFKAAPGTTTRIGDSDVYVGTNSVLVSDKSAPLLFNGVAISVDSAGQVLDKNGIAILDSNGGQVYLSSQGELLDKTAKRISLNGSLLSANGIVYLSNGKKAFRAGNMQRIGRSDLYVTTDGQLVTLDGKPVRHQGDFVFRTNEQELINKYQANLQWQRSPVFVNRRGELVNAENDIFSQPGILFTYSGIMIDNFGKLTKPLINMQRVSNSDILLNESGRLLDATGEQITHYGKSVLLGNERYLFSGGANVLNRQGSPVTLGEDGNLRSGLGQGGVHTGILKDSFGVAIDRDGRLLSRPGKLSQRGQSDIYLARDTFLSDIRGVAIQYNHEDMFLDFAEILPDGAQGLVTYVGHPVLDSNNYRVYLSLDGKFIDSNGDKSKLKGVIHTADDYVVSNTGNISRPLKLQNQLTDAQGNVILIDDKEIFVDEKGQLVFKGGEPVLSEDGQALFLNSQGDIVNSEGQVKSLISTEIDQLTDANGEDLFFDNQKVYRNDQGFLVNEEGDFIRDNNGERLVYENGVLQTESGQEVKEDIFTDAAGNILSNAELRTKSVSSPFASVQKYSTKQKTDDSLIKKGKFIIGEGGILLDEHGKKLKYRNRDVFINEKGQLVDERGNYITDSKGEKLTIDGEGNIINSSGEIVEEAIIADSEGVLIYGNGQKVTGNLRQVGSSDQYLTKDGRLVTKEGKPILYNNEPVRVNDKGQLETESGKLITSSKGETVYISEDGTLLNRRGEQINEDLLSTYDGTRLSSNGEEITKAGTLQSYGDSNLLISESGTILTGEGKDVVKGSTLRVDSEGRVIDGKGRPLRYKRSEVFINDDGALVDSQGNLLNNSDGTPLTFEQLLQSQSKNNREKRKVEIKQPDKSKKKDENQNNKGRSDVLNEDEGDHNANEDSKESLVVTSNLSNQSRIRLNTRYVQMLANVTLVGDQAIATSQQSIKPISLSVTTDEGNSRIPSSAAQDEAEREINTNQTDRAAEGKKTVAWAGDNLYAYTTQETNTDYNNVLTFKIAGTAQNDPLDEATAFASVVVAYDAAVIKVNRICPKKGECVPADGIALDPATMSAGITADIDTHFWYRYGGLFLSSLLQGASEAAGESATRSTSVNGSGTTTVVSGLEGGKLAMRSLGKVGEAFTPALSQRVNRPPTIRIPYHFEIVIKLFEDVKI